MPDPVILQPDEAAQAYAAGTMQPAGPQEMLNAQGVPTTVDPEKVQLALQQGYKLSDKATNDHLADLHEAGEHPIEAGALGAARGLVPFAPSIIAGVGGPDLERQQLLQEASPTASKVGELAGNVGQAVVGGLLTGGAGDIAEGASLGAKVFDAADMAKQAAIFAGQGASNEINEQDLGDHGYNGEAILSQAGLGAALGAASSPAFALAKEVLPNPIALAGKAISKASDAFAAAVGQGAELAHPGVEGVGDAAQAIYDAAQEPGIVNAPVAVQNKMATNFATKTSDMLDAIQKKITSIHEDLKPEQIQSLADQDALQSGHEVLATKKAVDALDANSINPTMSRLTADLEGNNPKYNATLVDHAQTAVKMMREAAAESTSVPMFDDALHQAGRYLDDNVMQYVNNLDPSIKATVRLIEQGIRTPIRQALRDPDIMGPRVASANGELTDALHSLYQSRAAFYKTMGARDLLADGRPAEQVDISPSKSLAFLRGEDKLSQQQNRAIYERLLGDASNLNNVAARMATDGGMTTNTDEINNLIQSVAAARQQGAASAALAHGGGDAVGGFGAQAIGGALGSMIGGPVGGAVGAGIAGAAKTARFPAATLSMLGKIKALADRNSGEIAKGASRFFTDAERATVPEVALGSLRSGRDYYANASAETETEKRMAEVQNLVSNPQLLMTTLANNTSALADGAPNHALAVQTNAQARLRVLQGGIPPKPPQGMVPQKYPTSIDATQHFERNLQIVNHPTKAIVGFMGNGSLTPDMVAAADAAAPASMAKLRSAFQSEMVDRYDHEYSLTQKQMLSTLFKVPITPDVAPDQVAFLQSTFAPAPPAPPAGGPGKPRVTGMQKLNPGQAIATPSQSRQMES